MKLQYLFIIFVLAVVLAGCAGQKSDVSDDTGLMDDTAGTTADSSLGNPAEVEETDDLASTELDNSQEVLYDW